MKNIIKTAREKKGLMVREVAQQLGIDQALVSKFESGTRKPTREQVIKLAAILDLKADELVVAWLKERILYELGDDALALKALMAAEEELTYRKAKPAKQRVSGELKTILTDIDKLKKDLNKFRHMDSYRVAQALELEYTFESNRIEGNTLTLKETDLVINEGLTIAGKSMREHLEAINHKDAVAYMKHLAGKKSVFNERELLTLHNLVLRGIDPANAGKYRMVQVMIKGSTHTPPAPYLIAKQMEDFFIWYEQNKQRLHPVVLAAEMHLRVVTIHPFIDGNGRTSRLAMNLALLKHGYVIANIKGDSKSRMAYYAALEEAQAGNENSTFVQLIAETERIALERYLKVLKG
jgi:Fic family protein/DNA-binding XRE family transcriptional regulator